MLQLRTCKSGASHPSPKAWALLMPPQPQELRHILTFKSHQSPAILLSSAHKTWQSITQFSRTALHLFAICSALPFPSTHPISPHGGKIEWPQQKEKGKLLVTKFSGDFLSLVLKLFATLRFSSTAALRWLECCMLLPPWTQNLSLRRMLFSRGTACKAQPWAVRWICLHHRLAGRTGSGWLLLTSC